MKLWLHCRQPLSEACVWGKAYLPIALPLEAVGFGVVIFGGVAVAAKALARRHLVKKLPGRIIDE